MSLTLVWSVTADEEENETPPTPAKGVVTVDRLNVRARPGTTYEVVAKVVKGQHLTVVGRKGEWLEILCPEGTEAWCSTKYMAADGRITGDGVRVRSGPGVVFSVFAALDEGDMVKRIGETEGEWQKIEAPAQATVWVYGQFIDVIQPEPAEAEKDKPVAEKNEETEETGGAGRDELASTQAGTPAASENHGHEAEPKAEADIQQQLPKAELPRLEETGNADKTLKAVTVDDTFVESTDPDIDVNEASAEIEFRDGTLVSLTTKATPFATHALVERRGQQTILICYVVSDFLKLEEWENHHVRVAGRASAYDGWRKDVLRATGIQLLSP